MKDAFGVVARLELPAECPVGRGSCRAILDCDARLGGSLALPERKTSRLTRYLAFAALFLLLSAVFVPTVSAQMVWVVDQFNPSGMGGNSYSAGQITNVWMNWFGSAFQSLAWDATNDANTNPASGSMKITANFIGSSNQFEVYNGLNGIVPTLNGLQYTNFQCDVRFAPGSATTTNGSGVAIFGHLQFGVATVSYGQDYFGSVEVPATNTGWVHVSVPINAGADANLQTINDVLIHIYGPTYASAPMSGVSTLWVDNLAFYGPNPPVTNCIVNWTNLFQSIDGFGASSAWSAGMSSSQLHIFFSTNNNILYTNNIGQVTTNNGIGLSLLRNHIAYAGSPASNAVPTTSETSIMQTAQSLGARVWSTPWTPASGFKDNNGPDGGSFLGSGGNATNVAYANQLANYVSSMKSIYGVNLYALSMQNEPDAQVTTYEACFWTAQQFHDFATNLSLALAAKGLSATKIILPESENWQDPSNLMATAMSDPNVASVVGIIADHNYDGVSGPVNLVKNSYGKRLWETEVSLLSGSDSSINNGVYYAGRIYLFMTEAQVNAWHYWWLISGATGNQGLLDNNAAITKRLFTVGNYSRFVRPGFVRIGVSNNAPTLVSAYENTNSSAFAIVAVNQNPVTVTQVFNLSTFPSVTSVTPWITSSNLSLASQSAVQVTNSSFTYALPALSVVTFAGQQHSNTPPVLTPVPNQTINAGVSLVVTNVATDTNTPPPTLTFSLLAGPTTSTLNASNGVFSWRPLVRQANTTNAVSVQVSDNGTPPLTATNNFSVTVNLLTLPSLSSIAESAGQVTIEINGPLGPDYTLLYSTNLVTWRALLTTNSPAMPLTLKDTNPATNAARFYRIQIGP